MARIKHQKDNGEYDCERTKKQIPAFVSEDMSEVEAKHFLSHVDGCPSCMEELCIQFLVTVGMERLDKGEAFNLNRELDGRLNKVRRQGKILEWLQTGLYYLEAAAVLTVLYLLATMAFQMGG